MGKPQQSPDPRLAWFVHGGEAEQMLPSAELADAVEGLSGDDRRFSGATQDELEGLLDAERKLIAHAEAQRFAIVRAMIRLNPGPGATRGSPGGLPSIWAEDLAHEIAPLLHVTNRGADKLIALAWELEGRLPNVGRLLDQGKIEVPVAQAVMDELGVLNDELAAEAERRIVDRLPGKTPGKARGIAKKTAVAVDPEGAEKRREQAEADARVAFYADHTGTYTMFASGLPAAEALMAERNVNARALQYKNAELYPGASMDYLRTMATLDLLSGTDRGVGEHGAGLPANVNLTLVLPTLQGWADRAGEAPGLGVVDPALSRTLADQAARNDRSNFCLTITTPEGWAVGHGCARPAPKRHRTRGTNREPWSLSQADGPGPPGGYGTWLLSLPGEKELVLDLHPVPLTDCGHEHETKAYRPGKLLRHLIEIRDGQCTNPSCSHPASACDFEHAVPYHRGGRTCGCNAGARSRRCHRVKQMAGWKVTQPRPGWHRWETPSGRVYTQGPKEYPV